MELGAFSISLAVEDLETSRAFYAELGFDVTGGDDERYIILRKPEGTPIGLFGPESTRPASIVLEEPDGNPVLIDQHVPPPGADRS